MTASSTPAARPAPSPRGYADREVTQPPDWHEWVVLDVVLNAVTTGLFLVTAAGLLARPDVFAGVSRWAFLIALVALTADLVCLVVDLGNPLRFHHMLRVVKPSSPMSLGTWSLTFYSFPLAALVTLDVVTLLGLLPADTGWLAPARVTLVLVALPFAFGSAAYKGVLFSTTAQPGWRDGRWLGAYHVTAGLAIGSGVLWAVAELADEARAAELLRPAVLVLIVLGYYPALRLSNELRPTLVTVYTARHLLAARLTVLLGRFVIPAALTFVQGWYAGVAAAASLLGGAYAARAVMTHLPHRVAHRPVPAARWR